MSLIQQRMAIDRARLSGQWLAAVFGLLTVLTMFRALNDPADWLGWALVISSLACMCLGLFQARKSRRARLLFESEHGSDAGKQDLEQ